jgi:hypothetical protein
MKYKLKPGLGGQLVVNVMGRFYRLKETEYRDYPPEVLSLYKDSLEPEHETKTTKKIKDADTAPIEEIE